MARICRGSPRWAHWCRKLLRLVPELKRLRLSSIDSIEADAALMRAIAEEERLMPHFHLSAQSGDDMILKRMKRRHGRADTIAFCETVRRSRPGAAFGADLIAGFPTETEAMFENSLKLVDDAGLSLPACLSLFSPRQGTPAARMPQLPRAWSRSAPRGCAPRAKRRATRRLQRHDRHARDIVLVEKHGIGRTPCFARVTFDRAGSAGRLCAWRVITGRSGDHLTGVLRHEDIRRSAATADFLRPAENRPGQDRPAGLTGLFTRKKLDAATIAELEEALIRADMGAAQAEAVRGRGARAAMMPKSPARNCESVLAAEIASLLAPVAKAADDRRTAKSLL